MSTVSGGGRIRVPLCLAAGLPREKAASAASLILASVEGALILCRARREIAPFDAVRDALVAFVGP